MSKSRRVVILGLARQGIALARYLATHGYDVTVSDIQPAEKLQSAVQSLEDLPIRYVLGEHPESLLETCDLLCLSGGVPIDLPIVQMAQTRQIPLSNDSQIFMELCPAPIIGITGSAGKTTTTTLTYEMLKTYLQGHASVRVWVGGNIGNPLINDIKQIKAEDRVVMELSSFQLQHITRSPHIACITNITPNHLDRHASMQDYIAAKKHIVDYQTEQDWDVLCADDATTQLLMTQAHFSPAQTVWFSVAHEPHGNGAWMDENGDLRLRIANRIDGKLCHRRELQLMGEHNILNVLAASALAILGGATIKAVKQVATSFMGVAHRLQMVREVNGVRYYNDSIATAPERLMAGIRAFEPKQRIILLCGGKDKYLPWGDAITLINERCAHVVFFGELGPMVANKFSDLTHQTAIVVKTLREAVECAAEIAKKGDVVLLSPGGTSFDEFKDFAERGEKFTQWIQQL